MIKRILIIMAVAACLAGPMGAGPALAGSNGLLTINPVPSMAAGPQDEYDGYAYTDLVDGVAIIADMDDNEVDFSGDAVYPFAERVEYFDINGNRSSRFSFRAGKPAGYKLNQDGQVESLWEAREHANQ